MNAIDPGELSAYLDGELDAARAAEIANALAADPALRAEFEALQALDGSWTAAARSAVSRPDLRAAHLAPASAFDFRIGLGIVVLLALRFLPKLGDVLFWGVVLHAIVLVVVLASIIRMARLDAPAENSR